jgi:hypothetical protein
MFGKPRALDRVAVGAGQRRAECLEQLDAIVHGILLALGQPVPPNLELVGDLDLPLAALAPHEESMPLTE